MYKIISVRRALSSVFLAATAALLASCGGGGASSDAGVVSNSPLQISPGTEAQVFGNNPITFTVSGGRPPYVIESSDASIVQGPIRMGVNQREVTIVPLNPSFIESGLDPTKDLLYAPVNLTARDSAGSASVVKLKVVINFVAGTLIVPRPSSDKDPCQFSVCSGTTTVLEALVGKIVPNADTNVDNGYTRANRVWRFDVEAGDLFLSPLSPQTGTCTPNGKSCSVTTDQNGVGRVRASVPTGTPPQFAVLRITDVDTENKTRAAGVPNYGFTVNTFAIGPANDIIAPLTVLPSGPVTINGALTTSCGEGAQIDYYVFGGKPPYTVASPLIGVATVSPSVVSVDGGRFTATVRGCGKVSFIVVDSLGNRVETNSLETKPGTVEPFIPLTVSPQALSLECGQSASIVASGGRTGATKVANVVLPPTGNSGPIGVTATGSGNSITVTRAQGTPASSGTPPTLAIPSVIGGAADANGNVVVQVNVTDGTATLPVSVTTPKSCSAP